MWAYVFIFMVLILYLSISFYKNGISFDKEDLLQTAILSVVMWLITLSIVFILSDREKIYVDEYRSENIFDTISIGDEEYFLFSDINLVIPKDNASVHTVDSEDSSYKIVESRLVLADNGVTSLYSIDNLELDIIYDIYIPK